MNNSIAVTLIICGTLLIAAPFIHNWLFAQTIANVMVELERPASISTKFSRSYYTASLVIGAAMILTATVGAIRPKTLFGRGKEDL